MPTTRGYTYPDSNGSTEIWEHFQELAEDIDTDVTSVEDAVAARFVFSYKDVSETVTSSTTLQDDDELSVVLGIGTWQVEAVLHATGASGGDIKIAWTFSGTQGSPGKWCLGPQLGTTDAFATSAKMTTAGFSTAVAYGTDGTEESAILEKMLCEVTASGTLQLQWAQNASSGTATTLLVGSRITAIRVG
jgi:hypothetical protein